MSSRHLQLLLLEYVACYEATCHAILLQNFISALEVLHSISRPLKLFCNNSATVSFSNNTRSTSRFKHIDVKFFFVKKKVTESLISVEYTPTTRKLADPLTKGLPICVSRTHHLHEIVRSLEDSLFKWEFCLFKYFVRKAHAFSLLHAHIDVCHYLVILCHFD